MSRLAAGQWLYQLASYDPNNPRAASQVEAAYLLSNESLSDALADYNTFVEYFTQLQSGDSSNVDEYIKRYDELPDNDESGSTTSGTKTSPCSYASHGRNRSGSPRPRSSTR